MTIKTETTDMLQNLDNAMTKDFKKAVCDFEDKLPLMDQAILGAVYKDIQHLLTVVGSANRLFPSPKLVISLLMMAEQIKISTLHKHVDPINMFDVTKFLDTFVTLSVEDLAKICKAKHEHIL